MIKNLFKVNIIVLILVAIISVGGMNLLILYSYIGGPLTQEKTIIIEPRLSLGEIAYKLEKEEVIKAPSLFLIVAKLYSRMYPLKSGEYVFTSYISPLQVLRILASGKSVIHRLVVPEGVTVREIIDKINSEPLLFGEIKGEIPEGFLMPSTYFFSYGDHKEQIISKMRKSMSEALDKVMEQLPASSRLKTRLEVLTLASIVEKEARIDAERPIIAAVFLNRLQKGMKLQADPTTIYALTQGKFKLDRHLSKKDLAIESAYNTYYMVGLPPGPIACPGFKSLEAVVKPAKTNALYFVVNGNGGHNFSDTLEKHNENVKAYREIAKEKEEAKEREEAKEKREINEK